MPTPDRPNSERKRSPPQSAADMRFFDPVALNFEGHAPAPWQRVVPPGAEVKGRDDRRFQFADRAALVSAFNASIPVPVDFNHAEFLKAPQGDESPAAGWMEELRLSSDGSIEARIEWNASGAEAIATRAYRFLSPVFRVDAKGAVKSIAGAGLVNRPNLDLPALNAEGESTMKGLLKKLGLAEETSESDAIAAVERLQTQANATRVDLSTYVPRADYELALNSAKEAKDALAKRDADEFKAKAQALVDGAIQSGKVAPASREHWLALCADQSGLERVEKLIGAQPSHFKSAVDPSRKPPEGDAPALNAEQKKMLAACGITEESYLASQKELEARRAAVA